MNDLLQSAIDGLTPDMRAKINLDLARIQNCDNVSHDVPTPWPTFDLRYALQRYAGHELDIMRHQWDCGYSVKGLA